MNQHRPNGETVRNRTGQVGQLVEGLWAVLGAHTRLGASLKGSWRIEIGQGCKELKAAVDQIYVAGETHSQALCTSSHDHPISAASQTEAEIPQHRNRKNRADHL